MRFVTREERMANSYRKVEAMYRKGRSVKDIARSIELPIMDVMDIIQKIFAMDVRANRI